MDFIGSFNEYCRILLTRKVAHSEKGEIGQLTEGIVMQIKVLFLLFFNVEWIQHSETLQTPE